MIYQASDKSNGRLNRRCMSRFRGFISRFALEDVYLSGRRFTWSNRQEQPTMERLDRLLVSAEWMLIFTNHRLRPLSSDCSDHCPLLLDRHRYRNLGTQSLSF